MKKVDPKKAHCHDINSMRMTYSSWDRNHFGIKNGTKHYISLESLFLGKSENPRQHALKCLLKELQPSIVGSL